MKKLLTLLFAFALGLNLSAQVPDYVPTDGLVAWYPFNGNANDESGNGHHGEEYGISYVDDRFNGSAMAIACGEPQFATWVQLPNELETTALDFTFSFWIQPWSIDGRSELISRDDNAPQAGGDWSIYITDGVLNFETRIGNAPNNFVVGGNVEANAWSHVVINRNASQGENLIFLNGAIVAAAAEPFGALSPTNPIHIGRHAVLESLFFRGDFDDVALWNRALTEEEILALYNAELLVPGCADPTACNFNEEATSDDGSCIPSGCMETEACNYNALAECEGEACDYNCCPGPGCCSAGMFWDYELEHCMNYETCQEDLDGDGVIGVNDLMQLLSLFGTACEAEDVDPELGEFTCGDPINYHGYDYATVQIGEQCWFAENLRTELYQNGDVIPGELSDGEWEGTNAGAQAIFNNDPPMLADYGRLYNWFSVNDARGLCPTGWHVPTDGDFMTLEVELGLSEAEANSFGWRGSNQGYRMKSSIFWDGSNTTGFSMLHAGLRNPNGQFGFENNSGLVWSKSITANSGISRAFGTGYDSINKDSDHKNRGFSVRCLKDTE